MMLHLYIVSLLILNVISENEYDTNGYVVYCPCMGRFGNQADHFLGVLAFSKGLNRTLIVPPWIEYRYGEPKSIQVPFDTYFRVDSLKEYHRVITMELFMKSIAGGIWPANKRISFCYTQRIGEEEKSCNAKSGNPFGPFWDNFEIDFVQSEFYGPLNYDSTDKKMMDKWNQQYSPNKWPVLAFTGAPASFPVQKENIKLHKYLKWSVNIVNKAKQFIKKNMSGGSILGIHLRNGQDWAKACQHVHDSPMLFAAPQCVGYKNERGLLTVSMCLPQKSEIIKQVKRAVKKLTNIKYIFVASDSNHMIEDFNATFKHLDITVTRLQQSNPHLDLAILGQANYFIGNCVSSYSAFVKRERDVRGFPSQFWSYPQLKKTKHEEL